MSMMLKEQLLHGVQSVTLHCQNSCDHYVIKTREVNTWKPSGFVGEVTQCFVVNLANDTNTNDNNESHKEGTEYFEGNDFTVT
jgi:hypothetical protein